MLCDLLEYVCWGRYLRLQRGLALTSSRVNSVLQSHMNGGTGLAAELTFDENTCTVSPAVS
ncbi:MAG: hypothetical protein ACLTXH_14005 [Enterobacter hormaechei]